MNEIVRISIPTRSPDWTQVPVHRQVSSDDLMAGERVIVILHGTDEYRLRVTAAGKLMLTR